MENQVAHRPWPMPARPWVMRQTWTDLLFAHWPIEASVLRARIPSGLALDLFDDRAWVGVVPFQMSDVAPRGIPALPWLSAFPELNVRTYVHAGGKPGVFFFSLDAANRAAVWIARHGLGLPYFHASMRITRAGPAIQYESRRRVSGRSGPSAEFRGHYQPSGPRFQCRPGSLEHFLTERYCLYNTAADGRLRRLEIHHAPWTLQPATATFDVNTMTAPVGITLPTAPPLLHFAERQDMVAWLPTRV